MQSSRSNEGQEHETDSAVAGEKKQRCRSKLVKLDANLMADKQQQENAYYTRRRRCGKCEACLKPECGTCECCRLALFCLQLFYL